MTEKRRRIGATTDGQCRTEDGIGARGCERWRGRRLRGGSGEADGVELECETTAAGDAASEGRGLM